MKAAIQTLYVIFMLACCSCTGTKQASLERKIALKRSKDQSSGCFVQLTDGTIKNYSALKLVTGVCRSPHLLADKSKIIFPDEIIAYQDNDHYAVSAARFSIGGHNSNIAVETLPGFAIRIASGRLNVYVKKYKFNNAVADEFFLQEGNGQVLVYSPELMDALIKNIPEALDFFNDNHRHLRLTKQLKATAYIYNETYFKLNPGLNSAADMMASSGKRKIKK